MFLLTPSEAERRRKEEAERKAKLDEIAEKQRQRERELEEKERLRKQQILAGDAARPSETPDRPQPEAVQVVAPAAAAAPAPGKYVPRHLREKTAEVPRSTQAPPAESDRWEEEMINALLLISGEVMIVEPLALVLMIAVVVVLVALVQGLGILPRVGVLKLAVFHPQFMVFVSFFFQFWFQCGFCVLLCSRELY